MRNVITSLKNLAVIKNSNACKRQLIGHTLSQGQEHCKKTPINPKCTANILCNRRQRKKQTMNECFYLKVELITYIGMQIKDFTNEKRPQINFCPQKVSKYLSMWYN